MAVAAGTVTNIREASLWLSYTYLFVRMLRNPLAYGVGWEELTADPRLEGRRYSAQVHLVMSCGCLFLVPVSTWLWMVYGSKLYEGLG